MFSNRYIFKSDCFSTLVLHDKKRKKKKRIDKFHINKDNNLVNLQQYYEYKRSKTVYKKLDT